MKTILEFRYDFGWLSVGRNKFMMNLGKKFSYIVDQYSNKIAIKFGVHSSITFRQLDELSNQIANYLLEQGVKRNEVVVIHNDKNKYGFRCRFQARQRRAGTFTVRW